ncbi:MAG: trehalose-phosphatase [Chloroflexi bacterium]|jgi:trehalose 6-phosphate phosphatase|nr:trehalose-phosphatase [Chloroflexota bacterium]
MIQDVEDQGTKDPGELLHRLQDAERIRLFLDYDGTLAEFAPTPDDILPDEALIDLLRRLSKDPRIRVAVVSGRRLSHIIQLIPLEGILLAGTYGIEMQLPEGRQVEQARYDEIRPLLEEIKPQWKALLEGREGFYLEDKGWSLGIHAGRAADDEASEVLEQAVNILEDQPLDEYRILGGNKFLEIGPKLANKGETVRYLVDSFPWPGAELVFIGDDDKDEDAFAVIHERGGTAILVSREPRPTEADYRLGSPAEVRQWLEGLLVER